MPYDANVDTWLWFENVLASGGTHARLRAVELLRLVDGPPRQSMLRRAADDVDPVVAAIAVIVASSVEDDESIGDFELFESDFAQRSDCDDLGWEWEYQVIVCEGHYAPMRGVLVWTVAEDDAEAKRLAVMKASLGRAERVPTTALLVGKRFVNRFTRSARSFSEAMRWHRHGRPRLTE